MSGSKIQARRVVSDLFSVDIIPGYEGAVTYEHSAFDALVESG